MTEVTKTPGGLYLIGGRLCLDFCNTVSERFDEQPIDLLRARGYEALVFWCHDVGIISEIEAAKFNDLSVTNPEHARTVFDSAILFRESLYQVITARIAGQSAPEAALTTLNHWLKATLPQRELHTNESGEIFWRWREREALESILWDVVLSAGDVLTEDDFARIRQCPGCGWLFYDHSKNNARTWCDMRFCGNRAKNKRFHTRKKKEQ